MPPQAQIEPTDGIPTTQGIADVLFHGFHRDSEESGDLSSVVAVGDLLVTVNLLGGDESTLADQTGEVLKLLAAGSK